MGRSIAFGEGTTAGRPKRLGGLGPQGKGVLNQPLGSTPPNLPAAQPSNGRGRPTIPRPAVGPTTATPVEAPGTAEAPSTTPAPQGYPDFAQAAQERLQGLKEKQMAAGDTRFDRPSPQPVGATSVPAPDRVASLQSKHVQRARSQALDRLTSGSGGLRGLFDYAMGRHLDPYHTGFGAQLVHMESQMERAKRRPEKPPRVSG